MIPRIFMLPFTALYMAGTHGLAASYSSSEFFLRAWYPELGGIENATSVDDKDFASVPRSARLGRFLEVE